MIFVTRAVDSATVISSIIFPLFFVVDNRILGKLATLKVYLIYGATVRMLDLAIYKANSTPEQI